MRNKIFILGLSLLAISLIGCTRAAKESSAKVNLVVPNSISSKSLGKLGTVELGHVAINVTGAGIDIPIVYNWDSCRDCPNPPAIPTSFGVTVPSGTGRLIQILAVYVDSETDQTFFYYGDSTKDLTALEENVDISVAQVGQGTVTSGRAMGRYFTSTTEGPTGLIDIKYNPGNSKPSLIVDRGSIVNGWFNLFMLSGANLQYVLRSSGQLLWGREMSFDDPEMNPSANSGSYFDQRVRAYLPVHVRARYNGTTPVYYPQDANTYVWGYWGPGAVGKKVCTKNLSSSPVMKNLKKYTSGDATAMPYLTASHYINSGLTVPTKTQLTDTVNPMGNIVVEGGVDMSSLCGSFPDDAANRYTNFQVVNPDLFDGNGGDYAAGFFGILQPITSTMGGPVSVDNSDPRVLTGKILPGVESVYDGLRLFKRIGADDFYMDAPNCLEVASGATGFVPASSSDGLFNANGEFSLNSNITSAETSVGVSAVLCPVKSGILGPVGVFLGRWTFGGFGMMPVDEIRVSKNMRPSNLAAANQCFDISVSLFDSTRNMANAVGFTLTPTAASGATFYASSTDCGSFMNALDPNALIMPANETHLQVWVRAPSTATPSFMITPSSGTLTPIAMTLDVESSGNYVNLDLPHSLIAGACYAGKAVHTSLTGGSSTPPGTSINVNLSTTPGVAVYSTSDCSTPISQVALSPGVAETPIFVKITSTNSEVTITSSEASLKTANFSFYPGMGSITPAGLNVYGLSSTNSNICTQFTVMLVNDTNVSVPASTDMTINLAGADATFYADPSCTAQQSTAVVSASATYTTIWVKFATAGSKTFTTSAAGLTNGDYTLTVY